MNCAIFANTKLEREKLMLSLQNEMLRFERRLPPESKN